MPPFPEHSVLSHKLYDKFWLAPQVDASFLGQRDFPIRLSSRLYLETLEFVIEEVLWSIRGSSHFRFTVLRMTRAILPFDHLQRHLPTISIFTKTFITRIEPVGEPYREVCLRPEKETEECPKTELTGGMFSYKRKKHFHEKELKENGNMT